MGVVQISMAHVGGFLMLAAIALICTGCKADTRIDPPKPSDLNYEVDSMETVMGSMKCDMCHASLQMMFQVSLKGPRIERGVASQLTLPQHAYIWSQGRDAIVHIINKVCEAEVLPQRYVAMKLDDGRYNVIPLVNVAGALDTTRAAAHDALGPMGREIRGGPEEDPQRAADTSTRPKLAMSMICLDMVSKYDVYELANRMYKLHASAFGSSGPTQFEQIQREVCVESYGACSEDQLETTPPWLREVYRPVDEPTEQK